MASCRVYNTAIFVLLCTTICTSYGCRRVMDPCKHGPLYYLHGTLFTTEYCNLYRCDDSKWVYKYKKCSLRKMCFSEGMIMRIDGVKRRCILITNKISDWEVIDNFP
ncbi:hypothetical protein PoB_002279100 [Plakobranchus ocellatus]|uniref:Uncharacterized protein n=1 Tax=Plakobranchus ocellatus TaxID=259542 RepID=A0AAV3ZJZ4_9GAST|nr:hypothetical protein PoB_002279100 [Plakobranchus ocellatus]